MGVYQCVQGVEGVGAGRYEEQPSHLSRMAAGVLKAIELRDEETYWPAELEREHGAASGVRH